MLARSQLRSGPGRWGARVTARSLWGAWEGGGDAGEGLTTPTAQASRTRQLAPRMEAYAGKTQLDSDLALFFWLFLSLRGLSLGLRHGSGSLAAQRVRSPAGRPGGRAPQTWVPDAPCGLRSLARPANPGAASQRRGGRAGKPGSGKRVAAAGPLERRERRRREDDARRREREEGGSAAGRRREG